MHFSQTRKYTKFRAFFIVNQTWKHDKLLTKMRSYQIKSTPETESAFSNKQTKLSR